MKNKTGKLGLALGIVVGINVAMAVVPGVIAGVKGLVESELKKNGVTKSKTREGELK